MPKKIKVHGKIDIMVYNTSYTVLKGDKTFTSNAVSQICPSATTIAINWVDKEILLPKGVSLDISAYMKCTPILLPLLTFNGKN